MFHRSAVWLAPSAGVQVTVASKGPFSGLGGHHSDQNPSWTVAVIVSPAAVLSDTPVTSLPACPKASLVVPGPTPKPKPSAFTAVAPIEVSGHCEEFTTVVYRACPDALRHQSVVPEAGSVIMSVMTL